MQTVYKGRVFSVEVGTRRFPNGQEHDVEIVRHTPSVVLIPVEDDGRVVIVKQYRAPLDRETWELPAGSVERRRVGGGRPRVASAKKRSAACRTALERLRGLYPAPGFCDEELIFFRVSDLRQPPPDSPHKPDEDEDITTRIVHRRRSAGDGGARRDRRSEDRVRADADLMMQASAG